MGHTRTISIELSEVAAERLERLARSSRRSLTELAREAVDHLLEEEDRQLEAIEQAIATADAGGPFVAHEDMVAYLDALANGERPPPPPTYTGKPG